MLRHIESLHERQQFSLRDVVFAMVAARFVRPTSKLAIFEGMRERLYPGLMPDDIALQHFYRALDLLCAHRGEVEKGLFFHGRDLLSPEVDVVLYDLTTLRFESVREDLGKLRRFGFSKEKRSDCTQVVLGVMVDTEGIPLGFEVYPGNTVEGKTLKDIVEKVRLKFRVRRFVFVADRGLLSKENLKILRDAKTEFVVGMRIGGLAKKRPELYERLNFKPAGEGFEILETRFGEDRGLVTWSEDRAERDRKTRDDILRKIRKKLESKKRISAKAFVSNSNYAYFLKGLDSGAPALDETKIAAAERKDGFFALFCEAHLTKALRLHHDQRNSRAIREEVIEGRPLTAAAVLQELAEVRAVPVNFGRQTIWVRTDIAGHVAQLFRALNLRIPPRLLKGGNVVAQTPTDAPSA